MLMRDLRNVVSNKLLGSVHLVLQFYLIDLAKFALPVDDGELAAIETHPKLQK